jgi:hypothetical protein
MALPILGAQCARAFLHPLSVEQVREAYFLGHSTDDQKVIKFLDLYLHQLPYPEKGPYVGSVEFQTPYEQAVLRSRQHRSGYSSLDAESDYEAHPNLLIVRIVIFTTPSYRGPAMPPARDVVRSWTYDDFAGDFQLSVSQAHAIQIKKMTVGPACPPPGQCEPYGGVEILLHFDAEQFGPGTARIKVVGPDGQTVETEFDLESLE